ncbi:hypothetical protein ACFVVM_16030 [Nocardia sp. NPDC058176]|uniref:hypothetical protein n=1 Tax=Nocardia sp. NPDC058176 TaxID=3346368 RepID=UPI0036DA634C
MEGEAQPLSAPSTTPSAVSDCVSFPASEHQDDDEKLLSEQIIQMDLPVGTCLSGVHAADVAEMPGMVGIQVNLIVKSSTGPDDLRPVATDIAHLVKKSEVSRRTADLAVTNWGDRIPGKIRYEDYLVDDNFQENSWDGSLPRDAELQIWRVHIAK